MSSETREPVNANRLPAWDPERGRLRGRTVFLSASVPDPNRDARFRTIPDAQREIESGVVALARAVFSNGGRLLFGGHPSITPLVAMVAGEFMSPSDGRDPDDRDATAPPVIVYQLDIFRSKMTEATKLMERLGRFRIVWCETLKEEANKSWPPNREKYPESLRLMRLRMESPEQAHGPSLAMVCMGGMEGVLKEAQIYRASNASSTSLGIVAFAGTGGAAGLLSSQEPVPPRIGDGDDIDRVPELVTQLRGNVLRWGERHPLGERAFIPYPAICAELVDMLAQRV